MKLVFKDTGSGIMLKNGSTTLHGFEVASADYKFHDAQANVSGDTVMVSSERVSKPLYVRYAFKDHPETINFYNKEGFPAVPFRTDNLK